MIARIIVLHIINYELLLKRLRQSEFNYSRLAEDVNVSRNTIRNIMSGRTTPSHYCSASIAEALELTHEDIIAIFFPNINDKGVLTND